MVRETPINDGADAYSGSPVTFQYIELACI